MNISEVTGKLPYNSLEEFKEKTKAILCLPTLSGQDEEYLYNLIQVSVTGLFKGYVPVSGTLLPFARNRCIQTAYEQCPDFTHIFFLDDDMGNYTPNQIVRLFNQDVPIISGLTISRRQPYMIVGSFDEIDKIPEYIREEKLIQVKNIGMAFTLIKREVLDAVQEQTPNGPIWFTTDRFERNGFDSEVADFVNSTLKELGSASFEISRGTLKKKLLEAIALGRYAHLNSVLIGEDIAFCNRAREKGFECYIDCGVCINHSSRVSLNPKAMLEESNLKLVEA